MSERKVDVTGIWPKKQSSDILETQRARARPAPAPLVSIGTVTGPVINIGSAAGLDLAALLSHTQPPQP